MLLYVLALGLSHGVLFPTPQADARADGRARGGRPAPGPRRQLRPAGGPPPQVVEMEALGKRVGLLGATLNLSVVVILVLMIWKPGF